MNKQYIDEFEEFFNSKYENINKYYYGSFDNKEKSLNTGGVWVFWTILLTSAAGFGIMLAS